MERLTDSSKEIPTLIDNAEYWLQVYFKLKGYEDLEEQGRVVELPCRVGDKIYAISSNYHKCNNLDKCEDYDADEYLITWCRIFCPNGYKGIGILELEVEQISLQAHDVYFSTRIGRLPIGEIFLTKEEAEKKLADMQKGVEYERI